MANEGEYKCQFCTGDAWSRVVEQAGEFSRKEAALWVLNSNQYRQILDLSKSLAYVKTCNERQKKRIALMTIKLEEDNVLPDNVIGLEEAVKRRKGFSQGGSGEIKDWLSPLNIHAVFWAKQKKDNSTFVLTQYKVVFIGHKARTLQVTINDYIDRPADTVVVHVDPEKFCEMNDLFELIRKGDENE